jgi:hypothetical protein
MLLLVDALTEIHSKGVAHTNLHSTALAMVRDTSSSRSRRFVRAAISNFKRAILLTCPDPAASTLIKVVPDGHTAMYMDPSMACLQLTDDRADVFSLGVHMLHLLERALGIRNAERLQVLCDASAGVGLLDWYRGVYLREALYGHDISHLMHILERAGTEPPPVSVSVSDPNLAFRPSALFEVWMREMNTPVWRRLEVCMRSLAPLWSDGLRSQVSAVILRCLHPLCANRPRSAQVACMLREAHRFDPPTDHRLAESLHSEHTTAPLCRVPRPLSWPQQQLPDRVSAVCLSACRRLSHGQLDTKLAALSTLILQCTGCWRASAANGGRGAAGAAGSAPTHSNAGISAAVDLSWLLYRRTVHELTDLSAMTDLLRRVDLCGVVNALQLFLYLITTPRGASTASTASGESRGWGWGGGGSAYCGARCLLGYS